MSSAAALRMSWLAATTALCAATPSLAADLALKRVLLGTGGVGYFEYSADVAETDSSLTLRARIDQVDDILKSLIVIDPSGTATVTLPGKAGAAEAFASLPFAQTDLASLPALISALEGAEVSLEAPRKLSGRIVSAVREKMTDKNATVREVTRVSLLSGVTVEQFVLEDAEGLKFEDPKVGADVETALKALRAARDRSGRDIAIRLAPGGKRTVRIGYVAEAPVWKAAYRLSLAEPGGTARLQGWAVLENMTGTAWNNVALTLTSGSPVTFRQALYEPYYVARPTIAPPVSRLALPRTDQGQIAAGVAMDTPTPAKPARRVMAKSFAPQPSPPPVSEAAMAPAAPEPVLGSAASTADSAENLSGAAFSLTAPVEVAAGESLTLPFVDTPIAANEVSWIQSGYTGRNPWQAVSLANPGDVTLPAGSVTLYETTAAGPLFAGEAQLNILPPTEKRLIAFGEDQKVQAERELRSKGMISEIIVAKSMISMKRLIRDTTLYRLTNNDTKPRTIVVDHPREEGQTLAAPALADVSLINGAWRVSREVAPGKSEVLEVSVDHPLDQSVTVGDLSRGALEQFLGVDPDQVGPGPAGFLSVLSQVGIDDAMAQRLEKIAEAADAVEDANRRIAKAQDDRQAIVADQERLRANLGVAQSGGDLAKLATHKLIAEEALLEGLDAESKSAAAAQAAARANLEDLAGKAATQELRFQSKASL